MSAASDALVTAVAAVLGQAFEESINEFDVDEFDHAARAILASGLIVPTSAVLDLAQQWEDEAPTHDPRAAQLARGVRPELNEQRRRLVLLAVADELRALTRQENQK